MWGLEKQVEFPRERGRGVAGTQGLSGGGRSRAESRTGLERLEGRSGWAGSGAGAEPACARHSKSSWELC